MLLGFIVGMPVLLVFGPNSCWTFATFLFASLLFLDVHARDVCRSQHNYNSVGGRNSAQDQATTFVPEGHEYTNELRFRKQNVTTQRIKDNKAKQDVTVDLGNVITNQTGQSTQPSGMLSGVVVWAFFAILYFYKSGHLCDFSSLQFESAFIGNYLLPAGKSSVFWLTQANIQDSRK